MKYCLSYSKQQNQFHIETDHERLSRPTNGYALLDWYNSLDEAHADLEKRTSGFVRDLTPGKPKKIL